MKVEYRIVGEGAQRPQIEEAIRRLDLSETVSLLGPMAQPEVLEPQDRSVNDLEEQLRGCSVPVIGRIEEDRYLLDMRTVADDEIPTLGNILLHAFGVQTP